MFHTAQQKISGMLTIVIGLLFAIMIVCQVPNSALAHADCIDADVSISAMTPAGHSVCLMFHEKTIEQFGSVVVMHTLSVFFFIAMRTPILLVLLREMCLLYYSERSLLNRRIRQRQLMWRNSIQKLYRWFSASFQLYDEARV